MLRSMRRLLGGVRYFSRENIWKDLKWSEANRAPLTPISFLERAGSVYRDRVSIVYGSTRFTWAQTLDRCTRLASALASLHVKPGDVVSVVAPNIPAMYEMHFGVPMARAVLNTLNIRYDAHTMCTILKHSGAKVVFVDCRFIEIVKAAVNLLSQVTKEIPSLILIRELGSETSSNGTDYPFLEYEKLVESGDPSFKICWPEDEWDAITLNYTSGTTASPKGVVYNHRGAYLNTLCNILMWDMRSKPVFLWINPLFHCNGWCFSWGLAAQGGIGICLRSIVAKDIYDAICEHKVTHLCAAPTVLNILSNALPHERRPLPHRVEVMTGGSPPPPPLLMTIEKLGFNVTHIYGLTETYGPISSCLWKPEWDLLSPENRARLRSRQGVPHLGAKLDVKVSTTMQSVPNDGITIGEIMIKGNVVMSGYLKNPDATEKAFEKGWFHTGDLGVVHPDGYIELKDRSKDVIISGGENVSSVEVETVLYSHPSVLEAAVVGRPDDYWGETPCAFVTLKDSADSPSQVSPEDIINFCRSHLPHYMSPRTVIFGPLPKTSTGKIQKHLLREKTKHLATIFPRDYRKQ